MKVLLVDDDLVLLNTIESYLNNESIATTKASSGLEGLALLEKEQYDLVVLDVQMPTMSGLDVLRKINERFRDLPVIMLTAKAEIADRVVGLELGADDYICKPFDLRELLARIRSIVRRKEKQDSKQYDEKMHGSTLEIDQGKREVRKDGKLMTLTSTEFEILSILFQNRGLVLSRDKIMDIARGRDFMAFDRSIDMHISHLRQKLEDDPRNPTLIKTVWGIGYVFTHEQ